MRPGVLPPKMHGDTLEQCRRGRIAGSTSWCTYRSELDYHHQWSKDRKDMVGRVDLFGANSTIVTRNFNADMTAQKNDAVFF